MNMQRSIRTGNENHMHRGGKGKGKVLSAGHRGVSETTQSIYQTGDPEVPDEKTPDKAGEKLENQIKDTEGERILKHIREKDYVIALAIEGKAMDSLEFARKLETLGISGTGNLVFVIGGSLGLSKAVLRRADEKLSFSRMTFPHQLMRVILLEQIYRGFRIMHKEPYHK